MNRLTVLEGLDGSGKSTQFTLLLRHFEEQSIPVRGISFPDYGEESSVLVRMYLAGAFGDSAYDVNAYAASSFYAVDRYASFKRYWQADYEAGVPVIAARYTTSNAVHQMSKLPPGQWDAYLDWLDDFEYQKLSLPRPDRVIFLDMPPDVADRLVIGRNGADTGSDIHENNRDYLRVCRKAALYAAQKQGWHVLPCAQNGTPLPQGQILANLLCALSADAGG